MLIYLFISSPIGDLEVTSININELKGLIFLNADFFFLIIININY